MDDLAHWPVGRIPRRAHDLPFLTADPHLARASGLDIAIQFIRMG